MRTFKEEELAGWDAKAGNYDGFAGQITAHIAPVLLDAARVAARTRVLDVASGPGYTAGAAAARGARVTGIDFAPSMLREARRNHPGIEFRYGDAEALEFAEGASRR
jgi:ubiquinone/menaquinone biosynthesis C-methylase UbiE